MLARVVRWFATGPDRPLITDASLVRKIYERRRLRVLIWLVVGYGFFYTCQLCLLSLKAGRNSYIWPKADIQHLQ